MRMPCYLLLLLLLFVYLFILYVFALLLKRNVDTDVSFLPPENCDSPLGMENGLIEDKQLSAHSAWDNNYQRYGSSRARLHLNEWPQGWRAQINDPSPWLQVDLLRTHTVTAVATQGYGSKDAKEWVKTYVLLTSRDGKRWYTYREGGRKRV